MAADYTEKKLGNIIGVEHSLYVGAGSREDFVRKQSIYDPSAPNALMNYDIDQFKNSIWENFLGSQVQISKVIDQDGSYKVTNQNVDKMGPV